MSTGVWVHLRYTVRMNENNDPNTLITVETIEADASAPTPEIVRRGIFGSFWHRDFTLFWLGSLASNIGTWMQNYALGIVVFAFRDSSFDLGLVNFLSGIPVLFLGLPAGVIADRVDRRKLLLGIQVVLLLQATALGVLYNTGVLNSEHATTSLAWVASLGLIAGMVIAFQGPSFQSMVPDLVPRSLLMNAIALNSAQFQGARMLGPLIAAALVLAGAGMGEVFYVNAASFLFVIGALSLMRRDRSGALAAEREQSDPREGTWATLTAGVRYAMRHRSVGVLLIGQALFTMCGMPYMMLVPALVTTSLGAATVSPEYARWTAYIMTANGLGALFGALAVAGLPTSIRRERIIPLGIVAFSLLAAAFALSHWFWLSLLLSPLAGATFIAVNSLTNTSIQASAPGPIRGRVMALFVMAFLGVMPISALAFGTLAEFATPSIAVATGAAILFVWSILLMARPTWLDTHPSAPASES